MSPKRKSKPAVFKFPLPIDPIRLIYGVGERWIWFIVLAVLFGVIGWVVGSVKSDDRYSVSLQLIKSNVPTVIQTSDVGQAFRPRELSDDTLLSTTYSTEVLERTGARLDPVRSSREVKGMVEIVKQRNTALFYLTAHSRISAQDAITSVSIWADEIIRFTNNLQREEARQMEAFISEQLDTIEVQLARVNDSILDFARENQFVDADSQISSALAAHGALGDQLAYTRIALSSKAVQVNRYRQELRSQSPLESELKEKKEELTYLRGRYTDVNPLVKEKLYEIEYIQEQLELAEDAPIGELKNFTGSPLGNNLYLELISLENERTQLENMLVDLERRLEASELRIAHLPEKALRLNELKSRRDSLIKAQSLLESRRKEAAFYETKAPGYWQVFQKPSMNEVALSSQNAKSFLLGMMGLLFGGGVAFLFTVAQEIIQRGIRTPIEAAIVTSTLPVCLLLTSRAEDRSWFMQRVLSADEALQNERALKAFWLAHEITNHGEERRRFLFVSMETCDRESVFWSALFDLIQSEGRTLNFCNLSGVEDPSFSELSKHPAVLHYFTQLDELAQVDDGILFVRLGRTASVKELERLKQSEAYYLLSSASQAERYESRNKSEIMRRILGQADGLVIVDHGTTSLALRLLKRYEMFLLSWYVKNMTQKKLQEDSV